MSFLFFIWKNGLSFGRDINGICRCVEFVGVMIIKICLVYVFKNWKLLFENICRNTCGWKSVWKCVKCCLKTKNSYLKIQTKHPLNLWRPKSPNSVSLVCLLLLVFFFTYWLDCSRNYNHNLRVWFRFTTIVHVF